MKVHAKRKPKRGSRRVVRKQLNKTGKWTDGLSILIVGRPEIFSESLERPFRLSSQRSEGEPACIQSFPGILMTLIKEHPVWHSHLFEKGQLLLKAHATRRYFLRLSPTSHFFRLNHYFNYNNVVEIVFAVVERFSNQQIEKRRPTIKNMAIILIRNMSVEDGHCNGTRYKIEHLSPYLILALARKLGDNSVILIPRNPMESKYSKFTLPNQQRSECQPTEKRSALMMEQAWSSQNKIFAFANQEETQELQDKGLLP
jgi:hypothetical protein